MNDKLKEHVETLENVVEARRLGNEKLKLIINSMKESQSDDIGMLIWLQSYISTIEELRTFEKLLLTGETLALDGILEEMKKES